MVDLVVVFPGYWLDGLHMATEDEFHLEPLSDEQIHDLARYIIDEFGIGLSPEELDELIGVVMENVPGLELASTRKIQQLTKSIRRQYNDQTKYDRNQD